MMNLLKRISVSQHLVELNTTADITEAESYERKGWVVLRRTKPSKSIQNYGSQAVFAHITDAGRRALEAQ